MSDERNEERTIWNDPDKAKIASFLIPAAAAVAVAAYKVIDGILDHVEGRGQHHQ